MKEANNIELLLLQEKLRVRFNMRPTRSRALAALILASPKSITIHQMRDIVGAKTTNSMSASMSHLRGFLKDMGVTLDRGSLKTGLRITREGADHLKELVAA